MDEDNKHELQDQTEMSLSRILALCLSVAAVWLVPAGWVVAQGPTPASSGGGSSGMDYVLSYLIVLLALVLGMLVVARSSGRRERERPASYVGQNIAADD